MGGVWPPEAIQTIQKEEKDFAKNSLTLSDTEREKISRKLQQGKIDAKRDERELREDIDIRRREEINKLQTQVNKTIEEIAKDQNFDLIVYQRSSGSFCCIHRSDDLHFTAVRVPQ